MSASGDPARESGQARFAVGYRVMSGDPEYFSDIVRDYRDHIAEVYFAWPGWSSGRSPVAPSEVEQVGWDLGRVRDCGVALDLLLNASCFGEEALSVRLAERAASLVGELAEGLGIETVTTMSPLVARTVKRLFPGVDVRASVNMRLGTARGMGYVSSLFDSYCVRREFNRDPRRLAELQEWAERNGKGLHVLVNSGCLNFCSFQTFHDNAVAHEPGVNAGENVDMTTLCREHYSDRANWADVLRAGSWIRPEDVPAHRRFFRGGYKLATRMHDNPRRVIDAYARARCCGSLLDLLEPGHAPAFYPHIVDNTRFPDDWFERVLACSGRCAGCDYCARTLERVLVDVEKAVSGP